MPLRPPDHHLRGDLPQQRPARDQLDLVVRDELLGHAQRPQRRAEKLTAARRPRATSCARRAAPSHRMQCVSRAGTSRTWA